MSQTTEDTTVDEPSSVWVELASEQQQSFYENLPECTIYGPDEHKYLKQNIGYAIFGLPENATKSTTEDSSSNNGNLANSCNNSDADVADTVNYDEEQKSMIDNIYKKICECVNENDNSQSIYFGIIYNIICSKTYVEPKKEMNTEKTDAKEENNFAIACVPVFAIRKRIKKKFSITHYKLLVTQKTIEDEAYSIWYMDISARIYKSWLDYKKNNKLPECIMVLPKDGCYQADKTYPITEDYSTVLLEIIDSPACAWSAKLCRGLDIASAVTGVGGMGLCVASLFTPAAPVAIAGLVASGVTGVWSIGRSSHHLIDRSNHEESIDLRDREAFAHWLSLSGSVAGLGVIGGATALSIAATRGMTLNIVAKTAFNTVQGSSIFINGVGILYQGYCLIDKYRTEETFSYMDTLSFVTHVMFFANSVINVQFAGDIIKSSQGKFVDEYKQSLRSKNLRRKFNRIKRRAGENNTNKISENAEVIRFIRNRQQLQSLNQGSVLDVSTRNVDTRMSERTPPKIVWSYEQGKVKINDIALIDPLVFVMDVLKSTSIFTKPKGNQKDDQSDSQNSDNVNQLIKVLRDLLNKFYGCNDYPKSKMHNFEPLLRDISSMNIQEDYLKIIFHVATRLITHSTDKTECLLKAMMFIWQYSKENLKQWGIRTPLRSRGESACSILQTIIKVLYAAEMFLDELFSAFLQYVEIMLRQ